MPNNFESLISDVAGVNDASEVTEVNFNAGLDALGINKRGKKRVNRGLKKYNKAKAQGRTFEQGSGEFGAFEDGEKLSGSGARKGNKKGFNAGDLIGLGNQMSFLSGALDKQKIANETAASLADVPTTSTAPTAPNQGVAEEEAALAPVNNIAKPKTSGRKATAPVVQGATLEDIANADAEARQVAKEAIARIEANRVAEDAIDRIENEQPAPPEATPETNTAARLLFGNAAHTGNESPLLAGAEAFLFPNPKLKDISSWQQAKDAFNDKTAANKQAFENKLNLAKANGETSFEHQGTSVRLKPDGTYTIVEGGRSPFDLGLFTPGLKGGAPTKAASASKVKPSITNSRVGKTIKAKTESSLKANANAAIDKITKTYNTALKSIKTKFSKTTAPKTNTVKAVKGPKVKTVKGPTTPKVKGVTGPTVKGVKGPKLKASNLLK